MSDLTVTAKEFKVLEAIFNSEFQVDLPGPDRIGYTVWSDCLHVEGMNEHQIAGTLSSICKKGLADSDGECTWITEKGYKILEAN